VTAPDLAGRLFDMLDDFAEHGITPTPLHAVVYAIDHGLGEDDAAALADMIRQRQQGDESLIMRGGAA
jgi:hypothetical protein